MTDHLISVIIPTFNAAETLARCIESARNQTTLPHEIIVINDGSTDHTRDILKSYSTLVHYLEQPNSGQGAARNAGLRHATGTHIAFLDSDDYWMPDFLKTCVTFLDRHPEIIAVSTGYILKKIGAGFTGPQLDETDTHRYKDGAVIDHFFEFWAKYDHLRTGTALIRKEVIDRAGPQRADLRISQDLEYWGYLATYGRWGFIPDCLWIGDSSSAAASKGWASKYVKRRRLCPSVESWEERITERLHQQDWPGFISVRGRVANSFAYNKLLGGDNRAAKSIMITYGHEMPDTWTSRVMKMCAPRNRYVWEAMAHLLRLREQLKSFLLYYFPVLTHRMVNVVSKQHHAKKTK